MKKWVLFIIALLIVLIGGFFVFSQETNTIKLLTYQEYINKFTLNLKTNNSYAIQGNDVNRKGIIKSFCKNIFEDEQLQKWFQQDNIHTYTYSPQDSVFLKLVCRNINSQFGADSNIPDSVIKMSGVLDWIDNNGNCKDRGGSMNSCNMSMWLSELLHTVINDYTTIKTVWLFWNSTSDWSNMELQIQLFSNDYFGICDGKEGIYLNKNTDKSYCNHPNTYNMLSNYIKKVNQNLSKTSIIDYQGITKIEWSWMIIKTAFVKDCNQEITTDKVWCGLNDFNNLVMNELMYYTMLLNFYKSIVPTSQQYLELTAGSSFANRTLELEEEVFRTNMELEVANNSVWSTLKSIRNLYTRFPVHVWLVAYLEDLVRFRDELVKLYTPIHQTYYKFRNIQVPD